MILPPVDMTLSALLFVIFLIVLLGPFLVKKIEHNLEIFLFTMGVLAVTVDHFLFKVTSNVADELLPIWNLKLIEKAIIDPIEITLAVLIAGLIFHYGRSSLKGFTDSILNKVPLKVFVFLIVVVLGIIIKCYNSNYCCFASR